jgi:hypothetical protein
MCKHCGSNTAKIGYCSVCNKEICFDCKNKTSSDVHESCSAPKSPQKPPNNVVGVPKSRDRIVGVPKSRDRIGR